MSEQSTTAILNAIWQTIAMGASAPVLAMDEKRFFVAQGKGTLTKYRTKEGAWAFSSRFAATYTKAEAEPLLVNGAYLKEAP